MTNPLVAGPEIAALVPRRRRSGSNQKSAYLYLLPFGVLFAAFAAYPLVYSIALSFEAYIPGSPAHWNDFANYVRALGDPTFWLALGNVLLLMVVTLPLQFAFGYAIASIMNAKMRAKSGWLSGIYYLPVIANLIVVSLLFQVLFQSNGIVNFGLSLVGLKPLPWLSSSGLAPVVLILLIFWKGVGWYIVFLLAGLRGIDPSYREAAKVDGANSLQIAMRITLPLLRPITTFLIVLGIISGWQIFTEPMLLFGGGGPENSVLTPATYIYQQGFSNLDFGYASALSVFLAVITFAVSGVILWLGRRESR